VGSFTVSCFENRPKTGTLKKEAVYSSEALILANRTDSITSQKVAVLRKTNENIPGVLTFHTQKVLDWGMVLLITRRLPYLLALP
jgi:hypothetical protein